MQKWPTNRNFIKLWKGFDRNCGVASTSIAIRTAHSYAIRWKWRNKLQKTAIVDSETLSTTRSVRVFPSIVCKTIPSHPHLPYRTYHCYFLRWLPFSHRSIVCYSNNPTSVYRVGKLEMYNNNVNVSCHMQLCMGYSLCIRARVLDRDAKHAHVTSAAENDFLYRYTYTTTHIWWLLQMSTPSITPYCCV